MGTNAAALWQLAGIEPMAGQFHQRISEPAVPSAVVVGAVSPGQWLQRSAQRRAANGVEHAADRQRPTTTRHELQAAVLHGVDVVCKHGRGVRRMSRMCAVKTEASDRVLECLVEQRLFIEPGGSS